MIEKVTAILGSVRFWIVTLAWASSYLAGINEHGFTVVGLFDQLAVWLGSVAALGTLDSVGKAFAGTK